MHYVAAVGSIGSNFDEFQYRKLILWAKYRYEFQWFLHNIYHKKVIYGIVLAPAMKSV